MKNTFKKLLTRIFTRQTKKIIAKHGVRVVAVAGSVGKTGTKLAIATTLKSSFRVQYQEGNYNVPLSVPFIFLGRALPALFNPFGWLFAWIHGQKLLHGQYPYDVVVVELGTDTPGEIMQFASFLNPDISVVTAVAEEHMEYFGTLDGVAAEELSIAKFSKSLVVNADDIAPEYLQKHIPKNMELHSYGFEHAEYQIEATKNDVGNDVKVELGSGEQAKAYVNLAAKHSLKAVAASVAVADLLDMDASAIEKGIANISAPSGRMQILKGKNDSTIIDDTYNASPIAVIAALEYIYSVDAPQRIAILGNMNELGDVSADAHTRVGEACDPSKLDLIITIGPDANKYLAAAAEKAGCNVVRTDSPYAAGKIVQESLKPGSIILAKGSQNRVFAEESLKILLADEADIKKLVRQSDYWMSKKRKQFSDFGK